MPDHVQQRFAVYMTACYGANWETRLPEGQREESRQHFFMGALAYQALILNILDPTEGPLSAAEQARGDRLMAEINDEIDAFGKKRIFDLFSAATNGGGTA